MKIKLITVCDDKSRASRLIKSLDKFCWDYEVIETPWQGFGTKILSTRDYLIANPDVDAIFFCDAYDVVVLGTIEEALSKLDTSKITFSTEKACWPDSSLDVYYDTSQHTPWQFLNSGLYYAPRELFLALFTDNMPDYTTDDQLWFTKQYLFNQSSGIILDRQCNVFQSYSFIDDGEFGYENGRVQNLKTSFTPVFIHGNGRTDMEVVYDLI